MDERSDARLKLIFYIHFTLISLALVGGWGPSAYLFYNLFFVFMLLWSLFEKNAPDPIQHTILVNGISIFFDIVMLATRFPHNNRHDDQFSVAMAIINLIARPISVIILYQILQERNGSMGNFEGLSTTFGARHSSYQDIDRQQTAPVTAES